LLTVGANIGAHIKRLSSVTHTMPIHATVAEAASSVAAHMNAFLGTP
jgi:hypothetical protein